MVTSNPIRILVVDDEESIRRSMGKALSKMQGTVRTADSARRAFELIEQQEFDVILVDIRLSDGDGLELLEEFKQAIPDVEIILITGYGNVRTAAEAIKFGAYDYITKPFTLDRVELVVEKAYQRVCLQRQNRRFRRAQTLHQVPQFVGRTSCVEHIHHLIEKVAPTNVPVLITGESGTGKDVVANAIHYRSQRAEQPLIIKNCGTLQKELMRSELFGYCRGAFTGANETRDGLIALAHQGTLFLDEIGELPLEVQAALLRVLETQTYHRVGDKHERQVDVRFLFTTNRNLAEEAQTGNFLEGLYHRLNAFQIHIPPLRERKEDIPLLVEYFLGLPRVGSHPCRASKSVMQSLMNYSWPGNVRELRNVIDRGIVLAKDHIITESALPREFTEQSDPTTTDVPLIPLVELEKRHIQRVMEYVDGNHSQAAGILGIDRKTLYRKLKDYERT
jgi:two-component system NtrC family response regulator